MCKDTRNCHLTEGPECTLAESCSLDPAPVVLEDEVQPHWRGCFL